MPRLLPLHVSHPRHVCVRPQMARAVCCLSPHAPPPRCNIYLYLAESFPTSVRSTAFGLAMGVGRSGGVVSSALGGMLGSVQLAFKLYGFAFAVGGLSVCCFGLETAGRPLRDAVL